MRTNLARVIAPNTPIEELTPLVMQLANALAGGLSWENMQAQVVTLDVTMPSAWVDLDLEHSWAAFGGNYANPSYMKDAAGFVHLRGAAKSGTYGSSAIATLPLAYQPKNAESFAVVQTNATYQPSGRIDIALDGTITAPSITSVQTGTSTFLALSGSFLASDTTPVIPGAPFPIVVPVTIPGLPRSVLPLSCRDLTGAVSAPAPSVSWSPGARSIRIETLSGLLPERRYSVRLAVLAF